MIQLPPPLHIRARANNKDWFQAPLSECWKIFVDSVNEAHQRHGFQTHAFVLMSNHYHWIASAPEEKLSDGMCLFQTTTSRKIARLANRINRIYGARYKKTVISEPYYYMNAFRYVYQNPLRAGICTAVEKYPWSTFTKNDIQLFECEPFDEFVPKSELKLWLNTPIDDESNDRIRKALRRRIFKFPRDDDKKRIDFLK